jgi:hypothetical protein
MKKTVTLIISFIITISSYGQEENNCVNEVDTHPDVTPTQNHLDALPRDPVNSSTHDKRFINGWEWWMDPLNPNVDYNIPIRDMQMSASQIYEPYMEPINSNLFGGHYNYLRHTQRDVMLPEDGWELIAQNRGWYPDNDAEINWSQNTGLRSIPYLCFTTNTLA